MGFCQLVTYIHIYVEVILKCFGKLLNHCENLTKEPGKKFS